MSKRKTTKRLSFIVSDEENDRRRLKEQDRNPVSTCTRSSSRTHNDTITSSNMPIAERLTQLNRSGSIRNIRNTAKEILTQNLQTSIQSILSF